VFCTNHDSVTFDEAWTQLPVRAAVPSKDYLEVTGPAPAHPNERRRFVRFRCRGRAILEKDAQSMAAYTADISRSGMGIISPVQLFPHERVQVTTVRQKLPMIVIWCLRLGKDCYQCGCRFAGS
jgi:PilZ domain